MKKTVFFIVLFLLGLSARGAAGYHVGIGDVLKIEVLGETDFSGSMPVNPRGEITLKMVGDIPVVGLTVTEIREKLTEILGRDFLLDPSIKVEITDFKSKKILILGEVKKPGESFLSQDSVTLLEVISMAGGLGDGAGEEAIVFRRSSQPEQNNAFEKLTMNIRELLRGETSPDATIILPDDIINFPSRKTESASYDVYIEGKVRTPGVYEYRPGMTVYELCLKAGGFMPFSAENRTLIVRTEGDKITRLKADIKKIKKGDAPDIPLAPGDKVIVPESRF